MHLSMFLAWLQDNLIDFVLFLYLFLLMGAVLVAHHLSWFSVDSDTCPWYLHHADYQSHHQATKPHYHFKYIHPKAPILTHQADLHCFQNLQYSVDMILCHVCTIATSHDLLPCRSCSPSHSVTHCGSCHLSHPASASCKCNNLPFCPTEFGNHICNLLEGDIGCPDTVTHHLNNVCKPKHHAFKWKSVQEFVTMNDI